MSSSRVAPKPIQIAAAVIGNALEWYEMSVGENLPAGTGKTAYTKVSELLRSCSLDPECVSHSHEVGQRPRAHLYS
jgi:hypothetical protein